MGLLSLTACLCYGAPTPTKAASFTEAQLLIVNLQNFWLGQARTLQASLVRPQVLGEVIINTTTPSGTNQSNLGCNPLPPNCAYGTEYVTAPDGSSCQVCKLVNGQAFTPPSGSNSQNQPNNQQPPNQSNNFPPCPSGQVYFCAGNTNPGSNMSCPNSQSPVCGIIPSQSSINQPTGTTQFLPQPSQPAGCPTNSVRCVTGYTFSNLNGCISGCVATPSQPNNYQQPNQPQNQTGQNNNQPNPNYQNNQLPAGCQFVPCPGGMIVPGSDGCPKCQQGQNNYNNYGNGQNNSQPNSNQPTGQNRQDVNGQNTNQNNQQYNNYGNGQNNNQPGDNQTNQSMFDAGNQVCTTRDVGADVRDAKTIVAAGPALAKKAAAMPGLVADINALVDSANQFLTTVKSAGADSTIDLCGARDDWRNLDPLTNWSLFKSEANAPVAIKKLTAAAKPALTAGIAKKIDALPADDGAALKDYQTALNDNLATLTDAINNSQPDFDTVNQILADYGPTGDHNPASFVCAMTAVTNLNKFTARLKTNVNFQAAVVDVHDTFYGLIANSDWPGACKFGTQAVNLLNNASRKLTAAALDNVNNLINNSGSQATTSGQ